MFIETCRSVLRLLEERLDSLRERPGVDDSQELVPALLPCLFPSAFFVLETPSLELFRSLSPLHLESPVRLLNQ